MTQIIEAANAVSYSTIMCPICRRDIMHIDGTGRPPVMCAKCAVWVHRTNGIDVATKSKMKPTEDEVEAFVMTKLP